jgi:hypothetical protein
MFEGRHDNLEECKENNGGSFPEKGDIVIVKGRIKNDAIFADKIVKQECKIYKSMRDLK